MKKVVMLLSSPVDAFNDSYTLDPSPPQQPKILVVGPGIRPGMSDDLKNAIIIRVMSTLVGTCMCGAVRTITEDGGIIVHENDCIATDENLDRLYGAQPEFFPRDDHLN